MVLSELEKNLVILIRKINSDEFKPDDKVLLYLPIKRGICRAATFVPMLYKNRLVTRDM